MSETEELTDRLKQSWLNTAIAGATIFQRLQESLNLFPSREQWEHEFRRQMGNENTAFSSRVIDVLWQDAAAAGREFDRIGGERPMADVVRQTINWERVKVVVKLEQICPAPQPKEKEPPAAKIAAILPKSESSKITMKLSNKIRWILVVPAALVTFIGWVILARLLPNDMTGDFFAAMAFSTSILASIIAAPLHGRRLLTCAAALFILTCLCPPWQYTADVNGNDGFHSRQPAGYALIFDPPTNPDRAFGNGVQIDFGRLFLEWAVLAVAAGIVWVLVVKPAWARAEKSNRPLNFIAPTGNPKN